MGEQRLHSSVKIKYNDITGNTRGGGGGSQVKHVKITEYLYTAYLNKIVTNFTIHMAIS